MIWHPHLDDDDVADTWFAGHVDELSALVKKEGRRLGVRADLKFYRSFDLGGRGRDSFAGLIVGDLLGRGLIMTQA